MEIIIDPPAAPEINMACDEQIARRVHAGETSAILRVYQWNQPAISLGRRQKKTDLPESLLAKKLPVVWRPTGGGAVVHAIDELTYAIAFSRRPGVLSWSSRPSSGIGSVVKSFSQLPPQVGAPIPNTLRLSVSSDNRNQDCLNRTLLADAGRPLHATPGRINLHRLPGLFHRYLREEIVGCGWISAEDLSIASKDCTGPATLCFSAPVCGDLLYQGKKVAGSALRAWRECVLIQGSIQGLPMRSQRLVDVVRSTIVRGFQNENHSLRQLHACSG